MENKSVQRLFIFSKSLKIIAHLEINVYTCLLYNLLKPETNYRSHSIQNISKSILKAKETTPGSMKQTPFTLMVSNISFFVPALNQHRGKGEDKLCLCVFMPD